MNKRLYILLAVLAALVIVIMVYMVMRKGTSQAPVAGQNQNQVKDITKTALDKDKIPDKFPSDIPIEPNAVITQNYNASTKEGYTQATRAFLTESTLESNFTTYKTYLNNSGYKVANTIDRDNYKMLYGVKGHSSLQVIISLNPLNKKKTVTLSYTEIQ